MLWPDNQKTQGQFMTGKTTQAFTKADLDRWVSIGAAQKPDAPTITACLTAPEVSSFNSKVLNTGMVVSLKLDNGQTVTVKINPVVALQLLNNIIDCGKGGSWLDANARITIPVVDER
jgi:hypothetical protein